MMADKIVWALGGFAIGELLLLPFRVTPEQAVANLGAWFN